jgi:hypothetical protein
MNIGKTITSFYCGGCFGRRYDLIDAVIESEGEDWVVIRMKDGTPQFASFSDSEEKEESIKNWC